MEAVRSASFALCVASLLLIAAADLKPCPIELSQPQAVLEYGAALSINCTTQESKGTFYKIGWEVKHGNKSSVEFNLTTWTVDSFIEWEEKPSCFFTAPGKNKTETDQCETFVDLILYTFPDSIDINSTIGSNGVMTLSDEHNLTCIINNVAPAERLVVKWFKDGTNFANETFEVTYNNTIKPINAESEIWITPSREDSVYKCEALLDLGPNVSHPNASKEFVVTVHYGPEVNCSNSTLMVEEGTALKDVCNVSGRPLNSVQWFKDGKEINPNIPLTKNEYGNYTLKADGHKLIEKNFTIYILYAPKLTCNESQTVMENIPFTLSCIVEGFPIATLTFYKEGEEVKLQDKLRRKDGGFYTIKASNSQQTVTSQINITVIYPPSQISELEDSVVDVGSDVTLKCSSKGNPQPEYFWEYYNSSNVAENHEDGVSFLSITNTTAENIGLYTCRVHNRIGNVSRTVILSVAGVCPIKIIPNRMVVQYQSKGQPATCRSITNDHDLDLFWMDRRGKTNGTIWSVDTYDRFDLKPSCAAKSKHNNSVCQEPLDIVVYKLPDSVSVNLLSNSSSVVKNEEFQLQCSITNVAPVRNLSVRWYINNSTFEPHSKGTMIVTGCPPQNGSACDISLVPTPVNVSFTINVTVTKAESKVLFHCEPRLDLGAEGPQVTVPVPVQPLNLTVYYKPVINVTKLPGTIPVFNGYNEDLVCEADGHPPPNVVWLQVANGAPCGQGPNLTVSGAGVYRCNATNAAGSDSHEVRVILKEDYLPLLAGFVAMVVIIISVIFAFIYSIYYKNTKMRRYSFKNPKLNKTHNGNVAHNGSENQFPMKRLS